MDIKMRVEKIAERILLNQKEIIFIASQLDQAVREACCHTDDSKLAEAFRRVREEGFASAREKAAGIVETEAKTWGDSVTSVTIWGLEERIRAIEPY